MFRRFRYRKWLVAGACVAAVVVPSAALAGNNLGAKNSGFGAVSVTKQAQSQVLDPAIVKYLLRYGYTESQIAAMSGGTYRASSLDPAIVKYLLRYGYTESQIAAMSGGTYRASSLEPAIVEYLLRYGYTESQIAAMSGGTYRATNLQPKIDPMVVKYLLRYGYTESQIAAMSGGTYRATNLQPKIDPMVVKYLLRYGYTESQIAAMSGGALHVSQPTVVDGRSPDTIDSATQAHEPVVTVVRGPGFQWDDFGVGVSAALLALVAFSLSRFFSNRSGRRPATSS